jgi:hypothetical protein
VQPHLQLSLEIDTSLLAVYTCCHVDASAGSIYLCMQQGLLAAIVLAPDGSQDDHAYAIVGDVHQRCIVFDKGQVYWLPVLCTVYGRQRCSSNFTYHKFEYSL